VILENKIGLAKVVLLVSCLKMLDKRGIDVNEKK
jgi:hypothetical protein